MAAIRVVATVDFGVAIEATTCLFNICIGLGRRSYSRCNTSDTRCTVSAMALVANHGWTCFEQVVGGGAVGHVAVGAVVAHRAVVMDERTTFFHVAGVASFHYAIALHQLGACGAMGVMAIRARYFAFRRRVV